MKLASNQQLLWGAVGLGLGLGTAALLRNRRSISLRGKTVLITGGSRGLGLVLARLFAEEGAQLALTARDEEDLEGARQELANSGAPVIAVPCDVTDQRQVEELIATVRHRLGPVDVLVNNAGQIQVGPMEVQTLEDYEAAMRIHFWAPLYTTLAVLPEMRARRAGRIVNIASIGGRISVPHLLPYCASKFALVGLSEGLCAELAQENIRVTTVTPGLMRTGSPLRATFKGRNEAEYTWFSISGSLPGSSVPAERAARQIVAACKRGDPSVTVSLAAEIAVRFHGLFPGLTAELLGLVNQALPPPGGIGTGTATGLESETKAARVLARSSYLAAAANNELG